MKDAEYKASGLYRLVRPDGVSQNVIKAGHGYLWHGASPGPSVTISLGVYFKSVATGEVVYFHYDEMDPVEETE